jgi:hypothetical protein
MYRRSIDCLGHALSPFERYLYEEVFYMAKLPIDPSQFTLHFDTLIFGLLLICLAISEFSPRIIQSAGSRITATVVLEWYGNGLT